MKCDVEVTDEFVAWFETLDGDEQQAVGAAIDTLEESGPGLGRPLVDTISNSRHHNMKELRPLGTFFRILFVFDPRRSVILLLGGDKQGRWNGLVCREYPTCRPNL